MATYSKLETAIQKHAEKAKWYIDKKIKSISYVDSILGYTTDFMNNVEKELTYEYVFARTGKVFASKVWHADVNNTSTCERLRDSVGLTCTPSTDTVKGEDDFESASPIFTYKMCNYVADSDGTKRPTVLEGSPAYKTTGNVDVGKVSPTFWWTSEDHGTYDIVYMSDSPHDELGLKPFKAAVTSDGKILPYYVLSYSASATGDDGLPHSTMDRAPEFYSRDSIITEYAKKGTGYHGAGSERLLHGWLMLVIKYATKNQQTVFKGCSDFNVQHQIQIAETNATRVLISEASKYYAGCCVSVGTIKDSTNKMERGYSEIHSVCNRVRVKSIESVTIGSKTCTALNLDITTPITTTTDMYVISMPCYNGETLKVIGHEDGSYLSNTNGCHSFRLCGVEYGNGQNFIAADEALVYDADTPAWKLYLAEKGKTLAKNSIANMDYAGSITCAKGASDGWIGDLRLIPDKQVYLPANNGLSGSGDSVGVGDYLYWSMTHNQGDTREAIYCGSLGVGSYAGLGYLPAWRGLPYRNWTCGSAD